MMVTAVYLPDRGGTAIHTHEVATRLAQRGVEVTVVSTSTQRSFVPEWREGPVRVMCLRSWPPNRDYYVAPGIAGVIRHARADIVHLQGYHTAVAPIVMVAALRAGIPYVITLHSGGHSSRIRRAIRPAQAWLLRPLLTRARNIIAVSAFEADLFARRLRLPLGAFDVIPSGVDLPSVASQSPHEGPPLILSIGRVESYKGHHRVVEALPALDRARPGTRLRIAGSGPYEGELRRLAERLGVADRIQIAGVPADQRAEMAKLLGSASVVTMLSQYESQGLAMQEALALGRPLLISATSPLGELREHANVRVVEADAGAEVVAAAILELLDASPVLPPPMPTWEQCATQLLELYEKALATAR